MGKGRAAPIIDPGNWYIVCPVYKEAVGSGGSFRCTETLVVQAKSETEAAEKALAGTVEDWHGCAVALAEWFLA